MPNSGYFDVVFASSGDVATVPDDVQSDGSVSYEQGYGIDYQLDPATNPSALNIERTKMNQLFYDITSAIQQYQQIGTPPFITSAMNNGSPFSYSKYDRVLKTGVTYVSLENTNTDTPPTSKWAIALGGISGSFTANHAAVFADTVGTIKDGGTIRTALTTNTTFYVATTGNNANNGTAIGTPWLTLQYAWDYICKNYDLAGYTATIQLADGTYTGGIAATLAPYGGGIIINGNSGTPSNVIISTTSANCVSADGHVEGAVALQVQNLKLQTTTSGACLVASTGSCIIGGAGLVFGACAGTHVLSSINSSITLGSNYTITGGAISHWAAVDCAVIIVDGITITLTGTPAFSAQFATAVGAAFIEAASDTFTGSATGTRYAVTANGVINTIGAGATYLPGNAGGTTGTGGQYV